MILLMNKCSVHVASRRFTTNIIYFTLGCAWSNGTYTSVYQGKTALIVINAIIIVETGKIKLYQYILNPSINNYT